MTYLTENPWPLIFVLVSIAFISFLTASKNSGVIAVICLMLSVGLFFLERFLVSPSEEVQAEILLMFDNFKANDVEAISSQISDTNPNLAMVTEQGLELISLAPSFHIRSAELEMNGDENATALVRANGTVNLLKHGGGSRHVATYWRMSWQRKTGKWKLADVKRLNVTTGEQLDYFSK